MLFKTRADRNRICTLADYEKSVQEFNVSESILCQLPGRKDFVVVRNAAVRHGPEKCSHYDVMEAKRGVSEFKGAELCAIKT